MWTCQHACICPVSLLPLRGCLLHVARAHGECAKCYHGHPCNHHPATITQANGCFTMGLPRNMHWGTSKKAQACAPASEGLKSDSACTPGFQTRSHMTSALSTGTGPVNCMQVPTAPEGVLLVVLPLGLSSWLSGVANSYSLSSYSHVVSALFTSACPRSSGMVRLPLLMHDFCMIAQA